MKTGRIRVASIFQTLVSGLLLMIAPIARAEVTLDGSLGPGGALAGPDFVISEDLGRRAGNNLFHSFADFGIAFGESATFTGTAGTANVIGRVTGGAASSIDGMLRSTIDGANLFLLNPAGVIFGPNASLDVQGSFHVSTADYLRFSDGTAFHADPNPAGVLSVASPEAFGFLGPAPPAAITSDLGALQVPEGQTLSIIGGEITFTNDPGRETYIDFETFMPGPGYNLLAAPGGTINLASLSGPGEVALGPGLGIGSSAELGRITFTNGANISVASDLFASGPAGTVVIRGGEIFFRDSAIEASGNPSGFVDIAGSTLHFDNSSVGLFGTGEIDHPGTTFKADLSADFLMTNAAWIEASSFGPGRAGDIVIEAGTARFGDDIPGSGPLAEFGIYGYIASQSFGPGRGGDISLTVADFTVQNGFYVATATLDSGDAGNLTVVADSLVCRDQGQIYSNAFGFGSGGIIDITSRDILLSAKNATAVPNINTISGISAQTDALSNGGKIVVRADILRIEDGGKISTVLFGEGHGTDIELHARDLNISGFYADSTLTPKPYALSGIDARVFGPGALGTGGGIKVTADRLTLTNAGVIRTGLFEDAPGQAGSITVNAGAIEITSRGQIYADSFRGTGNSGNIEISANTLTITGATGIPRPEPLDFDFTGLSTTTNAGHGGSIDVSLTGDLRLSNQGGIKADTQGPGTGGAITVDADRIDLSSSGEINSSSSGTGNAGDIDLSAADSLLMRNGSITTEAFLADGGNIRISVPNMLSLVDSRITASVGGGAETTGGNISIDPEYVILKNSRIVANAFEGKGGNIGIVAHIFLADPQSLVDASSALGIDGNVDIQAPISNVSGILSPLSSEFTSASALLRERCMARIREGKYSSFVVGGRDGLPMEPGNLLASQPF